MSSGLVLAGLAIAGLANLAPVAGLLLPGGLPGAYGIAMPDDGNLILLLRHRALLFGLVGGLALVSLALPPLRLAASVMALISMAGFIALVMGLPERNAALVKIARIDAIACAPLLLSIACLLAPE